MPQIESFSPFTFNEDQKIASGLIEKFLKDPIDRVFLALERSLFMQHREYQYRWTYTGISRAVKKLDLLNNMCLY